MLRFERFFDRGEILVYSPQLNRLKSFRGRKIARPAALMIRALVAGYQFSKFRVVIRVFKLSFDL